MPKLYLLTGLLLGTTIASFAQSPASEAQAEKVLSADGSPALIMFGKSAKRYRAEEAATALRE